MSSQPQTQTRPRIEVISHGDAAPRALGFAHRPELLKGRGANNRRRIVPGRRVDIVRTAVTVHRAAIGAAAAGVVGAV